MKRASVILWVHPDFKKMIKVESASNNKSIIEYSEEIARRRKSLLQENDEVMERKKFGFRL